MSQYSTLIHETTRNTYFSHAIPAHSYVTRDEVDAAQEIQDKGIRREFKTVHEKLDILRTESTQRFDELIEQNKELRSDFNGLRSDLQDLRSSHERLESDVKDLKALFFNQTACNSWDPIHPVSINGQYPTNFPDRVIKFWHLQRPRYHGRLMSLIRFYKLDETLYYYYSEETHSFVSEEDDKSQDSQTEQQQRQTPPSNNERLSDLALQTLIKQQTLFILRVLANSLRLDFAAIQNCMPEVSASPPSIVQKRTVESEGGSPAEQKRAKTSTTPPQHKPLPTTMTTTPPPARARLDPNSSFFRALIRDPEEVIQRSPVSSEGQVVWDRGPRNILNRSPKTTTTVLLRSSPLSDDSSEGKLTSTQRLSQLEQSQNRSGSEKEEKPP